MAGGPVLRRQPPGHHWFHGRVQHPRQEERYRGRYVDLVLRSGSSGTGVNNAIVYGIAGPALDLLFKDELAISTDEVERVDVSIVAGVGFEISRFIIEGRGTWGFRNIAKETSARDVRSTTFAILAGLRFN